MASQGLNARMSLLVSKLVPYLRVVKSGAQTVSAVSGARYYNTTGKDLIIDKVATSLGTANTGATFLVDVNKNGTTIFTDQSKRPVIAISGNASTQGVPAAEVTLAAGQYLTFDVDQIGSTVAGSDLLVEVYAHLA
jgi:hypothetical protein